MNVLSPKSDHVLSVFKIYQNVLFSIRKKKKEKLRTFTFVYKALCDLAPAYFSDVISGQCLSCPLLSALLA